MNVRLRRASLVATLPLLTTLSITAWATTYTQPPSGGSGGGTPGSQLPLLDQTDTRAPLVAACMGQPDATPLPVDPRTLVKEGINRPGAAIQFNAWYVDLHNPPYPYLSKLPPRPKTCGEFRAAATRGFQFVTGKQYFQPFSSAAGFNNLWKVWGLSARPADFDEQIIKRYGAAKADYRNPYPLPGEDPNTTNGGSGQLPLGFMQDKWSNGRWNGLIGSTCSACHDSRLGKPEERPFAFGRPNDANDAGVTQSDIFRANGITAILQLAPLPWSVGRGSTDALGIVDFLPALFDMDSMLFAPSLLELFPTHAAGMNKAPAWWHRAWKTRQFWDGALTSDNVRSEMAFAVANLQRSAASRRNIYYEFEDINIWLLTLSPPTYKNEDGAIDTTLAEQGAVIFHERDLWANGANANIPKQPGNGSCASCHGVYSPRHAADPAFLPDPRLKGVAGVITPIETIRTDNKRMGVMADETKRRAWETSWLAYNELNPNWKSWNDNILISELRRIPRRAYDLGKGPVPANSPTGPNIWIKPFGYVAPPLYGTWQSAPYFHNGSVPTIWDILKPSDRPKIWQRWYTEPGLGGKNRGYDPSLASYDFKKLGWRYTALTCNNNKNLLAPYLPCSNDGMTTTDMFFASMANVAAAYNTLAYQSPPPVTDKQIQSRMVYNTYLYGQDAGGHDFTQSLTDDERWALLEYLKTL
ncbi:hypothetical protein [Aquabacterium sp.]|uniref:rubber dioxygenase RoxA n=1 Tax=Aquabacterium sp. TaxID=1872578 RepID=UPI0025BBC7FA|nr:hypothetical protein [Aquabacterium sp.]